MAKKAPSYKDYKESHHVTSDVILVLGEEITQDVPNFARVNNFQILQRYAEAYHVTRPQDVRSHTFRACRVKIILLLKMASTGTVEVPLECNIKLKSFNEICCPMGSKY